MFTDHFGKFNSAQNNTVIVATSFVIIIVETEPHNCCKWSENKKIIKCFSPVIQIVSLIKTV